MPGVYFTISFKGTAHPFALDPETTLADLKDQIEVLTSVPPSFQKLLYRGKKAVEDDTTASLQDAGLKDGLKITLMGSTSEAVESLQAAERETRKKDEILRRRAGPSKLASTSRQSSEDYKYRFHRLEPLHHLPNPAAAMLLLEKLAADPAILHVMRKHQFSVGMLTELAPHEHPELLGLNQNAGQIIKLRLRTDAYDGMRVYKEVRRVLCHELTHNVWGEHDDNFKTLNSQLNREVEQFEASARSGTHSLSGFGSGDYYEPDSTLSSTYTDAEVHSHVLGGSTATSTLIGSKEEMRARALEAALERRRKQDEEIERSCGSDGPAALQ